MTIEQLNQLTEGLGPCEYRAFAARVCRIDPVLGATVRLHAAAADGNSPAVTDWPRHTLDDAAAMDAAGVDTVESAERWWADRYGVTG